MNVLNLTYNGKRRWNIALYSLRCCIMLHSIILYHCKLNWGYADVLFTLFIDFYRILTIFGEFLHQFCFFEPKEERNIPTHRLRSCIMLSYIVFYRCMSN